MDSNQSNTGLLRFRSAPGLQFDYGDLLNGSKANSESERLFSRFCEESESPPENGFRELDDKSAVAMNLSPSSQHHKYGSRLLPPHYPRPGLNSNENGSFGLLSSSMAVEDHHHHHHHHQGQNQVKSLGSNLVRQSSSPAGLFSQISLPNGFGSQGEASPSPNRLKTQMSFSSRLSSSLGILSQISELGNEGTLDEEKLRNGNGDSRFFGSEYPYSSWNDSSNFTENFGGLRRDQDSNRKLNSSIQNEEFGSRIPMLSHHLSLPKNSVEVERYLHFQDSVPCKVRAKRGCATHPRSIAERVRRTRISERMRKLQDLVPNMDKQTNTADMLDLAVDYIKELQKQFKSLSDKRANCKCINIQKKISNQVV